MFKRVSTGLDSIIDKLAENDNVIVVSHGDIIKLAIAKILGLPIEVSHFIAQMITDSSRPLSMDGGRPTGK